MTDKQSVEKEHLENIEGGDTQGKEYASVEEMWKTELQGDLDNKETGWYGKAIAYWEKIPPTVDGVLGGLGVVHERDIRETAAFLSSLKEMGRARALDCGAGIGRISKALLISLFVTVDLVEPVEHMIQQAQAELLAEIDKRRDAGLKVGQLGELYREPMQKMVFTHTYDLILVQWAAIYLHDEDFVAFFRRCKEALNAGGVIFFKDNVMETSDKFLVDKDDSSLTRSDRHYKALFGRAGLTVVKEDHQRDWPKDLFPVKMFALR